MKYRVVREFPFVKKGNLLGTGLTGDIPLETTKGLTFTYKSPEVAQMVKDGWLEPVKDEPLPDEEFEKIPIWELGFEGKRAENLFDTIEILDRNQIKFNQRLNKLEKREK